MSFTLLLFFLLTSLGWLLIRRAAPTLTTLAVLALSPIVGILTSTWIYFLAIWAFGYEIGIEVITGLLCIVIGAANIAHLNTTSITKQFKKFRTTGRKYLLTKPALFISITAWTILLVWIANTRLFQAKPDGYYSGGGAWGDLALHSTFTTYFAQQETLSLRSPIYSQEVTTYPFMINFLSGILFRQSSLLSLSLFSTSAVLIISIVFLLHGVAMQWLKKSSSILLFVALFLLNGGIGWYYFWLDWKASLLPLWDFLWKMRVEYAHLADYNLRWSNVVADYFMPQRAFLVGLTAFLACLYIWKHALDLLEDTTQKKNKRLAGSIWTLSGFLIGLLPFFHVHGFLVSVVVLFSLTAWLIFSNKLSWKRCIPACITALLLSAPQLYWQFFHTLKPSFVTWHPGWLADTQPWLVFWLRNMGPLFILIPLAVGTLFVKKWFEGQQWQFLKLLSFLMVSLFILTNVISFQPHHYDNMKFMLFAFVLLCLVVVVVWEKVSERWPTLLAASAITILLISTSVSGALSVLRESYTQWIMIDTKSLERAKIIQENTPPGAIFLTNDNHNHVVSMVAGRSIVMGYRGWLWTHGIDYANTEYMINTIFTAGPEVEEYIDYLNISYIYIGPSEKITWRPNTNYFDTLYPTIYRDNEVAIYKVR